jgi:ferrous iron transport protein A
MPAVTLADAPLATPLTIVGLPVGLARRLTRMGLREGTSFSVLRRSSGGGRVVAVAGSRVALGASVLRQVVVEVAR